MREQMKATVQAHLRDGAQEMCPYFSCHPELSRGVGYGQLGDRWPPGLRGNEISHSSSAYHVPGTFLNTLPALTVIYLPFNPIAVAKNNEQFNNPVRRTPPLTPC